MSDATARPACPCCEQALPESADLLAVASRAGLSPTQGQIMALLARSPGVWVSTRRILETVYGDRADGGPDYASTCVRVQISLMRKKLAPYGLAIESGRNRRRLVGVAA